MKNDSSKEAVHRLQALITRETGAPFKPAVEAEIVSIIRHACGVGGENIAAGPEPSFARREVTILLADLRGFTALTATLPAGTVIAILNRCLGRMSEIVSRHRGVIDGFMGDSIMVLFGAPVMHEDDVKRALACAIEMQLAMDELNHQSRQDGIPELSMGMGIGMTLSTGKSGAYRYYKCTSRRNQGNHACSSRNLPMGKVDEIVVNDGDAIIKGSYAALAHAMHQMKMGTPDQVPTFILDWRA